MDALTILRAIIEDGYLSETNMARGRAHLDSLIVADPAREQFTELCQIEFNRGDRAQAVRRFRSATGFGLKDAIDKMNEYRP